MELAVTRFYRALPKLAPQGPAQKAEQRILPACELDQNLVDFCAQGEEPSNASLTQQAWESARQLATSMSPSAFLNLALIAAMKVTDEATEKRDSELLLQSLKDQRPLDESPLLSGIYSRLEPHLTRSLPRPLLSSDPLVGEGLHAGSQILLNPAKLTEPNVALFVAAHEAGHAEGRHTVRSAALRESGPLLPQQGSRAALQQAEWDLEYEADARAVRLSVKAGLQDPRPVLRTLLEAPQDKEHPDGYLRALAVRDGFRELGVEVSDNEWQILLDDTQVIRDGYRLAQQKEDAFRRALAKFV